MNSLPKEDYISYMRSQMHRWDHQNGLDTARLEGEERGIQIGQVEEQLRIARNSKAKGLPVAVIAELTGLSVADIEQL